MSSWPADEVLRFKKKKKAADIDPSPLSVSCHFEFKKIALLVDVSASLFPVCFGETIKIFNLLAMVLVDYLLDFIIHDGIILHGKRPMANAFSGLVFSEGKTRR